MFALSPLFSKFRDGTPSTSIIRVNYSYSDSPGNKGTPVKSSVNMHPNDHISIAAVYGIPNTISGAL